MQDLNSLIIEGELKENASINANMAGNYTVSFTVVSTRMSEEYFFPCYYYVSESLAKELETMLVSGAKLRIVGRLNQHRWTDKDGKKWSNIVVVAEHIEIRKKGGKDGKSN